MTLPIFAAQAAATGALTFPRWAVKPQPNVATVSAPPKTTFTHMGPALSAGREPACTVAHSELVVAWKNGARKAPCEPLCRHRRDVHVAPKCRDHWDSHLPASKARAFLIEPTSRHWASCTLGGNPLVRRPCPNFSQPSSPHKGLLGLGVRPLAIRRSACRP